ncbi:MAG: GNAT family N-acetyltransferase [Citrobacter freundii]|nr:GNAT family N-acetyltransferase [Citrobacter freundii]HAT2340089.1 GNAT family N-acetyltransferase [Citrobacter freundii]HAT2362578.1 GNAT family N-acetyltransferase [Citrobacter freundii]HAU8242074.1 GNAT family N-acetyltransferase [Citrobacter freundii]HBI7073329.1 GNAT family N-acetyltransferase [Citrobacter freundii]
MSGSTDVKDVQLVKCDSETEMKGVKSFDCGDDVINKFIPQLKRQCGRDNINALLLLDGDKKLFGFATATLYQLGRDGIPEDTYPYALPPAIAVMKIPMIAIDKQLQRQGWGHDLLRAILDYSVESADLVKGIKGVYLDAKVDARSFYESFEFKALSETVSENGTIPMLLPMDVLRESRKNWEQSA